MNRFCRLASCAVLFCLTFSIGMGASRCPGVSASIQATATVEYPLGLRAVNDDPGESEVRAASAQSESSGALSGVIEWGGDLIDMEVIPEKVKTSGVLTYRNTAGCARRDRSGSDLRNPLGDGWATDPYLQHTPSGGASEQLGRAQSVWVMHPRQEGLIVQVSTDQGPAAQSTGIGSSVVGEAAVRVLSELRDRTLVQLDERVMRASLARAVVVTVISVDN